jgi:electron transfer flavoprotein beta subunit
MKILVCIKQVPQKDAPLRLNESGTWIRDDVSWETNEPDAYALEEALRQKEKHGGEVAVITAGPARSQQVLREALAKGADRAIHLEDDRFAQMDAANTARALAAAIEGESFDLIVTGLTSARHRQACCWRRFWGFRTLPSLSGLRRRIQD